MANAFKKRKIFEKKDQETLWGRIPEDQRELYQASNWQHVKALDVIKLIGQEEWDRCFKFTIVRNPYDRLVSFYTYSKSARQDPSSVQYGLEDPGSFEEWLEVTKPLDQLHYIADETGRVLVDYVGKFENLRADVFKISLKMKTWPIRLPKLNASKRRDYHEYYTPEIRRRVEELYGDEIETLKYQF